MQKIRLLDAKTINKIAAGEVVESPKSVVKELTENAIDANAGSVTIEIKEGGISYIRITDNGTGIPKEQVKEAFLRHATSKIKNKEEIELEIEKVVKDKEIGILIVTEKIYNLANEKLDYIKNNKNLPLIVKI